jgi:uncharacterized membrane protein HdeD (DUF308 family)
MNARFIHSGAMLHALEKNWSWLALRGVAALIFGLLAIVWPSLTLTVLVMFYGAFALADGVFALIAAFRGGPMAPRWWLALVGVCGIAIGLLTFFWPGITALVLIYFIACWAVITGVMTIVGAVRLRKEIPNEWLLIAGGSLSIVFGLMLVVRPGQGALALTFAIGAYAALFGVLLISFALRLRRRAHDDSASTLRPHAGF